MRLLVTSALPYANGHIHLGHMVEYIQTDMFVRYHRMRGRECTYICADDTHGTPIMLNAKKQGISPEQLVVDVSEQHKADFAGFGVAFDRFGSTHSDANRQLSEQFYQAALDQDVITRNEIQQFYCGDCAMFLPDRLVKGACPSCGAEDQYGDVCEVCSATYDPTDLKDPFCATCSATPEMRPSEHVFFQLSKFESFLSEFVTNSSWPESVKNKLSEWFEGGLKDWDISRDAPYFGFQIPGTDKYFYVWVDAPIGYIATTQEFDEIDRYWSDPDCEIHHFIGKDILYFHGLFWPAMLKVMRYNQPKQLHVHGFLTVDGQKMSKSRETFILAQDYLKELEPDFLRYYFAAKLTGKPDDLDLHRDDFVARINSDVLGKFINIGSRVGSILKKSLEFTLSAPDVAGQKILDAIVVHAPVIAEQYESINTAKLVREVMSLADQVNGYIQETEPWDLVKRDAEAARQVCTTAIQALRYLSIYLRPILPSIVERLETFMQIDALTWADLEAPLASGHVVGVYKHVAKRLDVEDVGRVF